MVVRNTSGMSLALIDSSRNPGKYGAIRFSIFSEDDPGVNNYSGTRFEMGTKFVVSQPTMFLGFRYWRSATMNAGARGDLFTVSNSTIVATEPFTEGTSFGWITTMLTTPYQLVPATEYMVSVYHGGANYCEKMGVLPISKQTVTTLTAAGFYATVDGQMPSGQYSTACYFIDGIFEV